MEARREDRRSNVENQVFSFIIDGHACDQWKMILATLLFFFFKVNNEGFNDVDFKILKQVGFFSIYFIVCLLLRPQSLH